MIKENKKSDFTSNEMTGEMLPGVKLGQKLKLLRKSSGMTQQQIAEVLGVSRSAIAFWETGREGSARKHLAKLAELLGVDIETFLTGHVQTRIQLTIGQDEYDLLKLYRSLDIPQKIATQKWIERQVIANKKK